MRLEILGKNLPVSPALNQHAHNRTHHAVDRFADRIRSIVVRLLDANGHRGGEDKVCKIETSLRGASSIVLAQAIDRDPYVAIDRATTALKETLSRQVDRLTDRKRRTRNTGERP